ncbi:hypothetical protein SAMN02745126_05537 [Enhydrobacter aerosaccus]|uniref:Uncharacterized protein n=1 Tax=Enhydrobacter aerosaccus TaxID=225324 RepID=A0A1T4T3B3_9HYPH|nr:hypothetical protein [Enhydrobacter aerosaccus]SKA34761.1 hypothetical protein SAMN02745126_05537 [Enhydrobacter aerosaccus]
MMTSVLRVLSAVGLVVALGACDHRANVANKEDMMVASGFRFVPVNTPERLALFQQLPPHKFLKQIKGDKIIYIYPDPTVCGCLYVGNAQAYTNYRKAVFDKRLADEQAMAAQDLDNASWNWYPWGPYVVDPVFYY